jgi:hypothetical protein
VTVGPVIDIPQPLAGPIIAALTTAAAYLITVDWTHAIPRRQPPEQQ